LGLASFLESCRRLFALTKKPGREEVWVSIRICLVGVSVIGLIGFIIRFVSSMLQGFVPTGVA
jgi:protein translocase SEC61 complex gamma subunit